MRRISVIVPCYNEEVVLPKLFDRLGGVAPSWKLEYEILCVDDGSHDRTWELLKAQNLKDSRWKGISLTRNFGHQPAVSAGLRYATGDAVVVIDADLQDPPEEIARFLKKWQEGYDVVFAIRKKRKEGLLKRLSYWTFYRLMAKLATSEIPLDSGDFCLMSKRVVTTLNAMPERNRFVRGLRAWVGFRQIGLEYERAGRAGGDPKYTPKKLIKLALDGLFSFSSLPLRLATYFGLGVSAFAFVGAFFTLLQKIFSAQFARIGLSPIAGFPTIVISVLFLGGVQLICLGILGEYMGRIYEEVKGRPHWIVGESFGLSSAEQPRSLGATS